MTAQLNFQTVGAALRPLPAELQYRDLRRQLPALFAALFPAPVHPIEVQTPDLIGRLGVVQTRHSVEHLRRIVHPFGTEPIHRYRVAIEQPAYLRYRLRTFGQ